MAYTDINTPVVQKITLPSGNEYYIADRQIRNVVEDLKEAIAAGVSFNIAWDGTSAPEVANIPSGVVVKYNGTNYTGTLTPAAATPGTFYLVKSATVTTESPSDNYDEYVVIKPDTTDSSTWYWEKIGDTQVDLSDVVTDVDIVKSSSSVIGSNATFTITQPTVSLATDASSGTGKVQVVTDITSSSTDSEDVVTAITGLGSPTTDTVIGTDSTFTVTQPTISLSAGTSSGTGKVSVVTGISSTTASGDNVTALTGLGTPSTDNVIGEDATFTITQPTIALATDTSSGTGKISVATGLGTPTKATVLTGVKVTTQPTVTLTANDTSATGRIQYVQSLGTVTTKELLGTASGDTISVLTGLGTPSTQNAVKSVSPTVKYLKTESINVVSGNTSESVIKTSTSQTTATGAGTASTTNTDWLKGISVSNGSLIIGAATLNTQSTNSANAASSISIPSSTSKTVVTGINDTGTTLPIVTNVAVGETFSAVTGYASPTTDDVLGSQTVININAGDFGGQGDVTVVTAIGNATTKYLSASADGTVVGSNGTASAITDIAATTSYIKATASGANTAWNNKDVVTAVTGYTPTTDTVIGTGSTFTVTPTTRYISGSATNGNVAWNSKDSVTVVTGYPNPTTDQVLGEDTTVTVVPTKTYIKATATGANTAWNNKDTKTVANYSDLDVDVTKGK